MRGKGRSFICFLMCIIMCTLFASCSFDVKIPELEVNGGSLSRAELARNIIYAIKDKKNVSDSYTSIPEKQLNGISYSYFSEFSEIMRNYCNNQGTIKSFRFLKAEEKQEYLNSIYSINPYAEKMTDAYGDFSVVEIACSKSKKNTNPPRFLLAEKGDMAFLSSKYLSDFIDSYNYVQHYLSLVFNQKKDGVISLLSPQLRGDVYINSVIQAKAEETIEYYKTHVKSTVNDTSMDFLSPYYMDVIVPDAVDSSGVTGRHKIRIVSDASNSFRIDDNILPVINSEDNIITYDNKNVLAPGAAYKGDEVNKLLGAPIYSSDYDLPEGESVKLGRMRLSSYPGMIATFYTQSSGRDYSCTLRSVRFYNGNYQLKNGVHVGMSISELLLIYPMIDNYGYKYHFTSEGNEFEVSFKYDENYNVTEIRIARI